MLHLPPIRSNSPRMGQAELVASRRSSNIGVPPYGALGNLIRFGPTSESFQSTVRSLERVNIKDKRVVIAGGSSGIGLATAKNLAQAGAQVMVASRSPQKLERARASVGPALKTHVLDVTVESQIISFFQSVGRFDHLVVTASTAIFGPFLELDVRAAREFFDSKFWSAYMLVRYGAANIASNGSVTLVSGAASQRGTPGLAAGSAINAALEALGRTLSLELAPIRVNTIAPGLIETPVWDDLMPQQAKNQLFAETAAKLPLRRIGTADDVAHTVRYVIENDYTTGSVLFPDGGYLQV